MKKNETRRKTSQAEGISPEAQFLIEGVQRSFKVLEENFASLKEEMRESLGQMETRLENLRSRMAEIQTELIEWHENGGGSSVRSRHN